MKFLEATVSAEPTLESINQKIDELRALGLHPTHVYQSHRHNAVTISVRGPDFLWEDYHGSFLDSLKECHPNNQHISPHYLTLVGDEIRAIFLKFDIKTIMARIPLEVTDWDNEITKQHYRDLDEAKKEAIEHFKPYLNETIIRDLRLKRGPKDWVVVPVTGTIRQIHFGIHGLTIFLNFIHPFTGKKEKTIIHI